VAQTAAKLALEPIFEADFEDNAWGYRPRRSAVDAVKDVAQHMRRGYTDVVDADLSKYFDTIPHDALMSCLARRIVDRHVLHLIKMWLKAPVEERDAEGTRRMSGGKQQTKGTPQGGVASPLLANLYMNRFLKHWRQTQRGQAFRAHVVNYADDFVILSRGHAAQALAWTKAVMTRIGLTINETKTSLKDARTERFDFLGYTFGPHHATGDGHVYLGAGPSRKSVQRLKTKVGDMLVSGEKRAWPEVSKRLNRMLNGWAAYFSHGALRPSYTAIDRHVGESVRMFLTKRSKSHGRGTHAFSQDKIFGELGVKHLMRWGSGSTSTVLP
jgi:RNA-directed DNA polymerase